MRSHYLLHSVSPSVYQSVRSGHAPDLQLMGNHLPYMGEPFAIGQITRPTQPFILTESINVVALSGERL